MSEYPPNNTRFGETVPPANLEFAPVQPIEIEPSFAGSTGLRNDIDNGLNTGATSGLNANSNNPFVGDLHSGSNSGLNTGVTSSKLDGTSNTTPFKSSSTSNTGSNNAGNIAQTAIDSLPSQETVINSEVSFSSSCFLMVTLLTHGYSFRVHDATRLTILILPSRRFICC